MQQEYLNRGKGHRESMARQARSEVSESPTKAFSSEDEGGGRKSVRGRKKMARGLALKQACILERENNALAAAGRELAFSIAPYTADFTKSQWALARDACDAGSLPGADGENQPAIMDLDFSSEEAAELATALTAFSQVAVNSGANGDSSTWSPLDCTDGELGGEEQLFLLVYHILCTQPDYPQLFAAAAAAYLHLSLRSDADALAHFGPNMLFARCIGDFLSNSTADRIQLVRELTSWYDFLTPSFIRNDLGRLALATLCETTSRAVIVSGATDPAFRIATLDCLSHFFARLQSLDRAAGARPLLADGDGSSVGQDSTGSRGTPVALVHYLRITAPHLIAGLTLNFERRTGTAVNATIPKHLYSLRDDLIAFLVRLVTVHASDLLVGEHMKERHINLAQLAGRRKEQKKSGPDGQESVEAVASGRRRARSDTVVVSDESGDEERENCAPPSSRSRPKRNSQHRGADGADDSLEGAERSVENQSEAILIAADGPVLALLLHCCLHAGDRKEWRLSLATAMVRTLSLIGNPALTASFCTGIGAASKSARGSTRMIAIDIICTLLLQIGCDRGTEGPDAAQLLIASDQAIGLFQAWLPRACDPQPGVRALALERLGDFLTATPCALLTSLTQTGTLEEALRSMKMVELVQQASRDSKQIVRKAVLQVVSALLARATAKEAGEAHWPLERDYPELWAKLVEPDLWDRACRDPSVQVRSKAVSCIASILVDFPLHPRVRSLWLSNVAAGLDDPEKSVCDKCLELISTEILGKMVAIFQAETSFSFKRRFDGETNNPYPLAITFAQEGSSDELHNLRRGLRELAKRAVEGGPQGRDAVVRSCVSALRTMLQTLPEQSEWQAGPLIILEEYFGAEAELKTKDKQGSRTPWGSLTLPKTAALPLLQAWQRFSSTQNAAIDTIQPERKSHVVSETQLIRRTILHCIQFAASTLPECETKSITQDLANRLRRCKIPMGCEAAAMQSLNALYECADPESIGQSSVADLLKHFCDGIVRSSEAERKYGESGQHAGTVAKMLQCLGAAAMLPAGKAASAISAIPADCVTVIEAYATRGLKAGNDVAGTVVDAIAVRASATLCMGRLAIHRPQLAKRFVPLLANLISGPAVTKGLDNVLAAEDDPRRGLSVASAVQLTAIAALADLTLCHTSIVDPYLASSVTGCLGAMHHPLVRRQALIVISRLLAEDFVKARGRLLLRLLFALADDDDETGQLTATTIAACVICKQTKFIPNIFLETMCYLNGWYKHSQLKRFGLHGGAEQQFSLLRYPAKRELVYRFFLSRMDDRDKLEVSRRLVHTLLAGFVDSADATNNRYALPPRSNVASPEGSVLTDALALLKSRQLKISLQPKAPPIDAAPESGAAPGAVLYEAAPVGTVSAASYEAGLLKRNLAYDILPTLLSLKKLMESERSPFLKNMLSCLGILLYDYRDELAEVLFHDSLLARQLESDYKRGLYQPSMQNTECSDVFTLDDQPHDAPETARALPLTGVTRPTGQRASAISVHTTTAAPAKHSVPRLLPASTRRCSVEINSQLSQQRPSDVTPRRFSLPAATSFTQSETSPLASDRKAADGIIERDIAADTCAGNVSASQQQRPSKRLRRE